MSPPDRTHEPLIYTGPLSAGAGVNLEPYRILRTSSTLSPGKSALSEEEARAIAEGKETLDKCMEDSKQLLALQAADDPLIALVADFRFERALAKGVRKGGSYYYPVLEYTVEAVGYRRRE